MTSPYFYSNGKGSKVVEASITTNTSTIEIRGTGMPAVSWDFADIAVVDQDANESILWLANDHAPYARLIIKGADAFETMWRLLEKRPKRKEPNWKKRFLVAGPLLGLGILLISLFGPSLNSMILVFVPENFDPKLGSFVINSVSEDWEFCDNEDAELVLNKIVHRLTSSEKTPYEFHVRVVKDYDINALAAPGGHIIILSGLIEEAESPEEIAGVLSHEMAHVVERHGTAMLVKQIAIAMASTLVGNHIHGLGHELVSMHMSRQQEAEADQKGAELLARAHISVDGLKAFFERLARKREGSLIFSILHSHPDSLERARALQDPADLEKKQILTPEEWLALKAYCGSPPGER